ncbi:MAG: 6-phosphogluconolactonase [Candidatus Krumholzibacteriia bacterium]
MPQIVVLPDSEAVAHEALRRIVAAASRAIEERGSCALVLAGGSTPRRVYQRLAGRSDVDWRRVHLFWGDERAVPPDAPDSNYRMVREALLAHIEIPPSRVHRMPADAEDLDGAARAYEELLRATLGARPTFDLVLLGLGADAHTASLFPGQAAVHEKERLVVATPAPVIAPRLTLTPPALNASRAVLFLVTGEGKREALRRATRSAQGAGEVPARAIRPPDGQVVWLVDRAAAGPDPSG